MECQPRLLRSVFDKTNRKLAQGQLQPEGSRFTVKKHAGDLHLIEFVLEKGRWWLDTPTPVEFDEDHLEPATWFDVVDYRNQENRQVIFLRYFFIKDRPFYAEISKHPDPLIAVCVIVAQARPDPKLEPVEPYVSGFDYSPLGTIPMGVNWWGDLVRRMKKDLHKKVPYHLL